MNIGKIRAIVLITIGLFLIIINRYIINQYREDSVDIILVLIILFAYIPAVIASLYVLTNGWILRAFLGPTDYGFLDRPKK